MQADILRAVEILQGGSVIAMPTETVYGLAANAYDDEAVQKIFAIKKRPSHNPLIIHCASLEAVAEFAQITKQAEDIFAAFSPGAMTVILPLKLDNAISELATAGLRTVAVRIPSHPFANGLLRALPFPLAAPSANLSGTLSPTKASHCAKLGVEVFDGSDCQLGLESTILDASGDEICLLRHGSIPIEAIESVLGEISVSTTATDSPKSPGQLLKHYAPILPLVLDVEVPEADDTYIAFGNTPHACFRNLSESGDPAEAARNLFAYLREADASGTKRIAVAPITGKGIAATIRDRLKRAVS